MLRGCGRVGAAGERVVGAAEPDDSAVCGEDRARPAQVAQDGHCEGAQVRQYRSLAIHIDALPVCCAQAGRWHVTGAWHAPSLGR